MGQLQRILFNTAIYLSIINDSEKDLIKQVLETKGISKNDIKQLKENNNFLFTLDGYDDIDSDHTRR